MNKLLFIVLIGLAAFIACKKDKGELPKPPPPGPPPFVEYRTPFTGTYIGINSVTTRSCASVWAQDCTPYDTVTFIQNYTFSVSISSLNDSSIIVNGGTYKINEKGYYHYVIGGSSHNYSKTLSFSNNSLNFDFTEGSNHFGGWTYEYRHLSGTKQ